MIKKWHNSIALACVCFNMWFTFVCFFEGERLHQRSSGINMILCCMATFTQVCIVEYNSWEKLPSEFEFRIQN